jgi:prolyl oligopeptidase
MVTTADHDDRVVPAHSFKFAATLQEAQACANPVLIRIETRSGHGSSNITKAIDLLTDMYSFMFHNMKIVPNY